MRFVRFSTTGAFVMANNSPEKVFRIGLINASVFANVIEPREAGGQKKTIRSVNLQRRYQDDDENWQTATSFQLSDLPAAIRVLQLAQQYVESVEADVTP
ncbi:MAG: hypothetical protein QM775_31055 [Pirellulales bacterium]